MKISISRTKLHQCITKLVIIMCVFGFSFPIFGFPGVAGLKLTFWRLGLVLMAWLILLMGIRLRSKLALMGLGIGGAMIIIRAASYFFSTAEDRTLQQLFWFSEGVLYLAGITILASHHPWLLQFYLKTVFIIGFVSVGFMAAQYIALQRSILLQLPLSDTAFGLTESLRPWTYPLGGGGRIIGSFYEPNMAGSMGAFYIATFAPFLLASRSQSFVRTSWLATVLTIALIGIFATGSRQALVTVGVTAAILTTAAMLRGGRVLRRTAFWLIGATVALIGIATIAIYQPTETPFGEVQMNVLTRVMVDAGGDATGGRLYWIQELIETMTPYSVIFGIGEGAGILAAHNAFLIVLNQNGIFGLALLTFFASGLFFASVRLTLRQGRSFLFFAGLASTCVAATWIGLIFMNWAQLNQSLSFMYLAIPFLVFTSAQQSRSRTERKSVEKFAASLQVAQESQL